MSLGFILGVFITLITTGLISFLGTCATMWAFILASSYSFYIYMVLYEESNFKDENFLIGMILAMI